MGLEKRALMTVIGIALIIQIAYAAQENDTLHSPPYDDRALLHEREFTPTPKNLVAKDNITRISGQNVSSAARKTVLSHAPPYLGRALLDKGKFTPPGPNPQSPAAKHTTTDSFNQNVPQPPPPYPGHTISSEELEN